VKEIKDEYHSIENLEISVVLIFAALIGWAIYVGNAWIPIPMIIAGVAILWLTGRKGKAEIIDERTYIVAYKASLFVFRFFIITAAAAGITLLSLGRGDYPELESAGMALIYSCCILGMLYYAAFIYYNKKYGGKE
jgi:uncharacterized membrane protein